MMLEKKSSYNPSRLYTTYYLRKPFFKQYMNFKVKKTILVHPVNFNHIVKKQYTKPTGSKFTDQLFIGQSSWPTTPSSQQRSTFDFARAHSILSVIIHYKLFTNFDNFLESSDFLHYHPASTALLYENAFLILQIFAFI